MNDDEGQIPSSEDEADALLAQVEAPADESLTDPGAPVPAADASKQAAAAQEYAFKHNGKEIKAPIEKLLKWASQGYDAPQKFGEFNKQLEGYKQKEAQFKDWETRFGPVDNYVKQNPQWWDFVNKQWEQSQQQGAGGQNPMFESLKKEVDELKSYKQQLEEQRNREVMAQEDTVYQKELEEVKKQWPKIDLDTQGTDGKSLEYRVLEHAKENGIKKFSTAFKDFYHDELMKMASENAKEQLTSDKVSKSKLGILGISHAPTPKTSDSVRGKSYNDLEREALRELGLA